MYRNVNIRETHVKFYVPQTLNSQIQCLAKNILIWLAHANDNCYTNTAEYSTPNNFKKKSLIYQKKSSRITSLYIQNYFLFRILSDVTKHDDRNWIFTKQNSLTQKHFRNVWDLEKCFKKSLGSKFTAEVKASIDMVILDIKKSKTHLEWRKIRRYSRCRMADGVFRSPSKLKVI